MGNKDALQKAGHSSINIQGESVTLFGLQPITAATIDENTAQSISLAIEQARPQIEDQNLKSHLRAVLEAQHSSDNKNSNGTLEQLDLFDDWANGAKKVSPEQKELSQLWRTLLQEIVDGADSAADLQAALQQITSYEALVLLRTNWMSSKVAKSDRETRAFKNLEKVGAIKSQKLSLICRFIFAVLIAVVLTNFGSNFFAKSLNSGVDGQAVSGVWDVVSRFIREIDPVILSLISVVFLLTGIVNFFIAVKLIGPVIKRLVLGHSPFAYKLTWLGKQLVHESGAAKEDKNR